MDKGTLVGIVAGMGVVIGAMFMGGSIMAFIYIPSLLIVLGGTIAATLVNFPVGDVIGSMRISE